MRRWLLIVSLGLGLLMVAPPASAQAVISATDNKATLQFPEQIVFSVNLLSPATIEKITLEYGVDQLTCGTVIAKAFPVFTPAKSIKASWTWEMKQSGSLPPGTQIHWRWRVSDAAGNELLTESQTLTWLDDQYNWQTISRDQINLHWYSGGKDFGQRLHTAAVRALATLSQTVGLQSTAPIDLYVYANTQDMQDVVLYEPGWTGGQAYPENSIIIIGIALDNEAWGKRTEAHEITHILVGRYGFGCLGTRPTWLEEGLAVYGEGGPQPAEVQQFDTALRQDKLISIHSLSGQFSEAPDIANLAYAESYSLVNFLMTKDKPEKILSLLNALREGTAIDQALKTVYGFDEGGLEAAWRAKIGAQPRKANASASTAVPTPVPTYEPIAGLKLEPTATPAPPSATPAPPTITPTLADIPTSTPLPATTVPAAASSSLPQGQLILIGVIGLVIASLVIVVIIVVAIAMRARRKS